MPILPKRLIKSLLHHIKEFMDRHPRLRTRLRALIYRLGLQDAARRIYARLAGPALYLEPFAQDARLPRHTAHLPPLARRIYQDLKAAIAAQHKDHA